MEASTLPTLDLPQATPVQVAVGAAAATFLAYKLLVAKPPHEQYAAKHGLTNIKPARRLNNTHFLMGDASELANNAMRFVDWTYEKTVEMDEQPWLRRVPMLPDNIIVATPELIEDVTKTQNDIFCKAGLSRTILYDLVGDGFFNQDGEKWFHQRKIASKFFSARMFRDFATTIINKHAEILFGLLEKFIETGEYVNMSKLVQQFTLQTFAELGFGLEMDLIGNPNGHPLDTALSEAFPQTLYRMQTPQWFWQLQKTLNIGGERKYREITGVIKSIVSEMVRKSLEKSKENGPREEASTIVELFIHAMQDGEGEGITPEILRDVAIMFVLGGRDTTAETIAYMLLMLSKYPRVEEKVRAELWAKVPELMEGKIQTLTMDQVQSLTYLEATIKETLRFYPPVPMNLREARQDTHLVDGTFVPKGCSVGLSAYALGRLRSVWGDDVLEFKPERFLDEATDKPVIHSAFKFFSFHSGPRICIGMNLALLELKLFLATLLSRYRLDVAPNDGSYGFSASLPLKNPLMARIRPAKASSH